MISPHKKTELEKKTENSRKLSVFIQFKLALLALGVGTLLFPFMMKLCVDSNGYYDTTKVTILFGACVGGPMLWICAKILK